MTRANHNVRKRIILAFVFIFAFSLLTNVAGLQSSTEVISSIGAITYPPPASPGVLRGVAWYGLDSTPSWYKMNEAYFNFMVQTFPEMNFLSLPISAYIILPNIASGDYNTVDNVKLNLLKNFVAWCKPHQIKILLNNYWTSTNQEALIAYWSLMAREFKNEATIAGFDLINEPWAFDYGDTHLIQIYENIVDAIRSVDPSRTCYVQSMFYHYQGALWRNVLRTTPVARPNIVYATHLYSQDYYNGAWYDNYTTPWTPYYLAHDYVKAKQVLESSTTTEYGGLYQRIGFIKQELGYPIAVTEIAAINTTEGQQFLSDAIDILNQWNVSWSYFCWYANLDRPMCLTYPNGTLRPVSSLVRDKM